MIRSVKKNHITVLFTTRATICNFWIEYDNPIIYKQLNHIYQPFQTKTSV